MNKFKVGQKVRCIALASSEFQGSGWKEGLEFTITSAYGGFAGECYYGGLNGFGVYEPFLKLVPDPQNLIIYCPTRELFDRVLEKLEKEGEAKWNGGGSPKEGKKYYKTKEEKTALNVSDNIIRYSGIDYYKTNPKYYACTFLSAEEYLREGKNIKQYIGEVTIDATLTFNQPKKSIMTTIIQTVKNASLSPDEKLKRKYDLHDDNGKQTSTAREIIADKFYSSAENEAVLLEAAKLQEAEEAKK